MFQDDPEANAVRKTVLITTGMTLVLALRKKFSF
jgi:hypothetical protein